MTAAVTPRNVVLNLVRASHKNAVSVRRLVAVGALFGFTANAVRVAIARLINDRLLRSDERGWYRLGPAAVAVHAHVEDWRRGEARIRPWKGEWLAIALMPSGDRAARRASLHALGRLGLREGMPGLWLRPDNLRETMPVTAERLQALGLEDTAELFRARDFGAALTRRLHELWPAKTLVRGHERALAGLERSLDALGSMPHDAALVETFLLGGDAIRVLATDPLLPAEIMAGDARAALTETMQRYDTVGRALWSRFAVELELVTTSRHAG